MQSMASRKKQPCSRAKAACSPSAVVDSRLRDANFWLALLEDAEAAVHMAAALKQCARQHPRVARLLQKLGRGSKVGRTPPPDAHAKPNLSCSRRRLGGGAEDIPSNAGGRPRGVVRSLLAEFDRVETGPCAKSARILDSESAAVGGQRSRRLACTRRPFPLFSPELPR
ncbi:hypothetical protein AK812_SmicGene20695 [Symbiodinium microadriaticum]|uniref:Uncharacterized protein n=1 Tax=Symbiodinium microadriaticum TaxID=2951 RepID=A0A1Q9DPC7_SYMMI|nr:hypothetical protein AK812_SmicGene20695 [Symbiodinium microadriaticum]